MPSLTVLCGPMFSGKTEALLARVRSAETSGTRVSLLKPALDTRHPGEVVSHTGARHAAVEVATADDIRQVTAGMSVVAFDEAQFLDAVGVSTVIDLARKGMSVTVAGLDLDFRAEPFPSVETLRQSADAVRLFTTTCTRCGREATRTQRFVRGLPAAYEEPIVVLGEDAYQPRCARCYAAERSQAKV